MSDHQEEVECDFCCGSGYAVGSIGHPCFECDGDGVVYEEVLPQTLSREIGDVVKINPYYDVTGTIVDKKDETVDVSYNMNYDYKVRFNVKMDREIGEWDYFNETELDQLARNWYNVKVD